MPMVDHKHVSQRNIGRLKIIYAGGTIDKSDSGMEEEKKSSEIQTTNKTISMKTVIDEIPDLTDQKAS